jgi:hypothetical protein
MSGPCTKVRGERRRLVDVLLLPDGKSASKGSTVRRAALDSDLPPMTPGSGETREKPRNHP